MSKESVSFKVPTELLPLVDDRTIEVLERWNSYTLADVQKQMPALSELPVSGGRKIGAAVLAPRGDYDNDKAVGLMTSYAQRWKPVQYVIAKLTQEIAAPEVPFYVFPNKSLFDTDAYDLSHKNRRAVARGDLSPIGEQIASGLESQKIGQIGLTGYSWGASLVPVVAGVGSSYYEVTHMNIDEAPYTPTVLRDFMRSTNDGGKVVEESGLPVSAEITALRNILPDYLAFFASGLLNPNNRAIRKGLKYQTLPDDIDTAIAQYPSASVKLGSVAGSSLLHYDEKVTQVINGNPNVRLVHYTGPAAHKHNTGDNTTAYALMARDGLTGF